jgi:hypothetical protein
MERTSQHRRDLIRHCQHAVHARTLESPPQAIPPLRVSADDRHEEARPLDPRSRPRRMDRSVLTWHRRSGRLGSADRPDFAPGQGSEMKGQHGMPAHTRAP